MAKASRGGSQEIFKARSINFREGWACRMIYIMIAVFILTIAAGIYDNHKLDSKNSTPTPMSLSSTARWVLIVVIILVILVIVVALLSQGGSNSGSGDSRTMGKCWICGKSGSFQVDGSYYCFEHYNDRMLGNIG